MSDRLRNILFIHSGGVTSVVNTVASVLYKHAQAEHRKLYIARFGVDGLMKSDFILASSIPNEDWQQINHTPASSFGSSRTRLPTHIKDFEPIFKYLDAHNIGIFFCNGGNNSQYITQSMHQAALKLGYPLSCIGIPKTIDNDIFHTDTCPGFGSAAKYTATSIYEMSLDLAAMCQSSTQVLIYEAMGRDTGWLAAASALARQHKAGGPHIILLPEAKFSLKDVLARTRKILSAHQHCVICLAEGARDTEQLLNSNLTSHTHKSLYLNHLISSQLQAKSHVVIPGYLQRSARHICSKTDIEQTVALTAHAYKLATSALSGIMVSLVRKNSAPYIWSVSSVDLASVAGKSRPLPQGFIRQDQLYVSDACIQYLSSLIEGEVEINYTKGIPNYSNMIYSQLPDNKENQ